MKNTVIQMATINGIVLNNKAFALKGEHFSTKTGKNDFMMQVGFIHKHIVDSRMYDATLASVSDAIAMIDGCTADAKAVLKLVSMASIKGGKTLDDASKEYVRENFTSEIKGIKDAIKQGKTSYKLDNGTVVVGCAEMYKTIEKIEKNRNAWKKEHGTYTELTLEQVSDQAFLKVFLGAICDCKVNKYSGKYEKDLARLQRRLEAGKITPDKYNELKAKLDQYK